MKYKMYNIVKLKEKINNDNIYLKCRKNENKKEIIVYDYVDDNFSMIRNMFLKRKKAYEKVGYEIIENNCQMSL